MDKQIKFGTVCTSPTGQIGIVVARKKNVLIGVGLNGKLWKCENPSFLAPNLNEFLDQKHVSINGREPRKFEID